MRRRSGRRVRRNEQQWAEILGRFEKSGLSSREFCRREGLAVSSLQRWRRRIGPAVQAEFVELVPAPSPASSSETGWALELSLPNGVCLRLRG